MDDASHVIKQKVKEAICTCPDVALMGVQVSERWLAVLEDCRWRLKQKTQADFPASLSLACVTYAHVYIYSCAVVCQTLGSLHLRYLSVLVTCRRLL